MHGRLCLPVETCAAFLMKIECDMCLCHRIYRRRIKRVFNRNTVVIHSGSHGRGIRQCICPETSRSHWRRRESCRVGTRQGDISQITHTLEVKVPLKCGVYDCCAGGYSHGHTQHHRRISGGGWRVLVARSYQPHGSAAASALPRRVRPLRLPTWLPFVVKDRVCQLLLCTHTLNSTPLVFSQILLRVHNVRCDRRERSVP